MPGQLGIGKFLGKLRGCLPELNATIDTDKGESVGGELRTAVAELIDAWTKLPKDYSFEDILRTSGG